MGADAPALCWSNAPMERKVLDGIAKAAASASNSLRGTTWA